MALRLPFRGMTGLLRASSKRLYFDPASKLEADPINDGATDGGIATQKDMSPATQARRFHRDFMRDFHAKRSAAKLSKEEFKKFTEEYEKAKGSKLAKAPSTIEELPQSDQDWLAGKDPSHPLRYHPFVMKRAKAMLAGTWIPAVNRGDGHRNEFKQPVNDPKPWIDLIASTNFEYWDDAGDFLPQIGAARCALTLDTLKVSIRAMLKCDKQNPDRTGHIAGAVADMMYDYQFCWDAKLDEETWNLLLEACAKMGDWQMGYSIEDCMCTLKFKPDAASLAALDKSAEHAWQNGYMLPPRLQGKDLADFFKIDTRGGVGAYVPLHRGESHGYELYEYYEAQKKEGKDTFVPAIGTPAWDAYAASKPELKKLSPRAAMAAFTEDIESGAVSSDGGRVVA